MSVQTFKTQIIPASGVLEIYGGNFFLLLATSLTSVDIRIERGNGGHAEQYNSFSAGLRVRRIEPWDRLRILGTAGGTVDFIFGKETIEKDEVDIITQIASIAGVAQVAIQPASSRTTTAQASLATATSLDVAANLLRKRIWVCSDSNNSGSVWIRDQAATVAGGIELQPGTSFPVENTGAFRVRNLSGAGQLISFEEET